MNKLVLVEMKHDLQNLEYCLSVDKKLVVEGIDQAFKLFCLIKFSRELVDEALEGGN